MAGILSQFKWPFQSQKLMSHRNYVSYILLTFMALYVITKKGGSYNLKMKS